MYTFSKDCLVWGLLPIPGKADVEKSMYFKDRFTGDPSFEAEYVEIKQEYDDENQLVETEELVYMDKLVNDFSFR